MVTIKTVEGDKGTAARDFIAFPPRLDGGCPHRVPPFRRDIRIAETTEMMLADLKTPGAEVYKVHRICRRELERDRH